MVPSLLGDYFGLRRCILSLPLDPYRGFKETSDSVSIAVDSTGIKIRKAGGWINMKHGKKKYYVKLHFTITVESKK